LSFTQFPWPYL